MARRNETAEEKKIREQAESLLQNAKVGNLSELQALMKEMMRQLVEGSLEGELEEEFSYSRYDYRQKDTDNSRNRYLHKTLYSDVGDKKTKCPETEKESMSYS